MKHSKLAIRVSILVVGFFLIPAYAQALTFWGVNLPPNAGASTWAIEGRYAVTGQWMPICEVIQKSGQSCSSDLTGAQFTLEQCASFANSKPAASRCVNTTNGDYYYKVDPAAPENQWKPPTTQTPTTGPGAPSGKTPTSPVGAPSGQTNTSPVGGNAPLSDPGGSTTLLNPLGGSGGPESLEAFLKSILSFIIRIGTIVVVVMMVYAGYLFVTAQGNPGALTKAKDTLKWTVVGALILLGSQAIADGIIATVKALGGG